MRSTESSSLCVTVLAGLLLGCAGSGPDAGMNALDSLQDPVTFEGSIQSTPESPVDSIHLTLRPGWVFFLRRSKGDHDTIDRGRWRIDEAFGELVLFGLTNPPYRFSILDPDHLHPIHKAGWQELSRAAIVDSFAEEPMRMTGMYRYREGDIVFTECATSARWPVASGGASAELERAYREVRGEPGQRLLVEVRGRFEWRALPDGTGGEEVLVVEDLIGVEPDHRCGPTATRAIHRRGRPIPAGLKSPVRYRSHPTPFAPKPLIRDASPEELPPDDPLRRIQKPPVPSDPPSATG